MVPLEGFDHQLRVAYLDTLVENGTPPQMGQRLAHRCTTLLAVSAKSPEWTYAIAHYEWALGDALMMEVGADFNFSR